MHLVEVLVRQVSDKALALETTAGAGYSAQEPRVGACRRGVQAASLENLGNQFRSLTSRTKSLGV